MQSTSILSLLEKVELSVGDAYKFYSGALASDRGASSFFFRLYLDERRHASIIRYQRKVAWQNPDLFSVAPMDIQGMQAVIARSGQIVEKGGDPTIEEALAVAIEFEQDFAELHFCMALHCKTPGFHELVSRLEGADRDHAERIGEFIYKRDIHIFAKAPTHLREAALA